MICPLCGYTFQESKVVCSHCALFHTCTLICCPNCGYQFPSDSWLVRRLKTLFPRGERHGTTSD